MQRAAFDWVATITLNSDRALKKKNRKKNRDIRKGRKNSN
jgi:hypothetical protein